LSRLGYCNAILASLPKTTIAPLQRAQNAAARLVAQLGPRDHVNNALRDLNWLPVQQRITYKLCLLMHLVHNDRAPVYLADSITATANISRHTRLWSASSLRYEQPRTRLKLGEHCFAFAGPAAWNSLPSYIQEQSNTDTFGIDAELTGNASLREPMNACSVVTRRLLLPVPAASLIARWQSLQLQHQSEK